MSHLTGKVAVVTGASKGIGAAIAERLAAHGASVVVNYARSAEDAQKVVGRITEKGGKAVAVQADVSDPAQVKALFAATAENFGPADILVNNAGVYEFRPLEAIDVEHIDRHFNLNVKGLLLATQEAVKHFGDRGGNVVNISSTVAITPPPTGSVYSATKGAVDVITRSLALELAPRKIYVNSVAPGMTETEGTASMAGSDEMKQWGISRTPLGRVGRPDDIAKVVAFVVSEDAGWITGEVLQAGGGIRL